MLKTMWAIVALPLLLTGCPGITGAPSGAPAPSPFSTAADKFLADYTTYHRLEMGKQAIDQSQVVLPMPTPVIVAPNPAPTGPPVVINPPGPVVTPSLRQQKRHGTLHGGGFWAEHHPSFSLVAGPRGITTTPSEAAVLNARQLP